MSELIDLTTYIISFKSKKLFTMKHQEEKDNFLFIDAVWMYEYIISRYCNIGSL